MLYIITYFITFCYFLIYIDTCCIATRHFPGETNCLQAAVHFCEAVFMPCVMHYARYLPGIQDTKCLCLVFMIHNIYIYVLYPLYIMFTSGIQDTNAKVWNQWCTTFMNGIQDIHNTYIWYPWYTILRSGIRAIQYVCIPCFHHSQCLCHDDVFVFCVVEVFPYLISEEVKTLVYSRCID